MHCPLEFYPDIIVSQIKHLLVISIKFCFECNIFLLAFLYYSELIPCAEPVKPMQLCECHKAISLLMWLTEPYPDFIKMHDGWKYFALLDDL